MINRRSYNYKRIYYNKKLVILINNKRVGYWNMMIKYNHLKQINLIYSKKILNYRKICKSKMNKHNNINNNNKKYNKHYKIRIKYNKRCYKYKMIEYNNSRLCQNKEYNQNTRLKINF